MSQDLVELEVAPQAGAGAMRRIPGDEGLWALIIAETFTFGMFFIGYMVYRAADVSLFNASQLMLDRRLAMVNTLVLVTSSWAVAQAVAAARRNQTKAVPRYLMTAIILAATFAAIKIYEYSVKVSHGIGLTTNMFFIFYYCLTMIHMAHVLAGGTILAVVRRNARQGLYHSGNMMGLETVASYWHMVDLLWIFLFALLYLLR